MNLRELLPSTTPPALQERLVADLVEGAATKTLFGRPKVMFPRVIAIQLRAFEEGTVIGYVYRDALEKLALTFMRPGAEPDDVLRTLAADAASRVSWYESEGLRQGEKLPEDLLTFFVMTELQRKGTLALSLIAWRRKSIEVLDAYQLSILSFVQGVAFGATHADRLRSMWRNTWEHPHDEVWATWKAFGLPLDPPPAPVRFEDRCADLQAVVEITVRNHYPHIKLRPTPKKRPSKK